MIRVKHICQKLNRNRLRRGGVFPVLALLILIGLIRPASALDRPSFWDRYGISAGLGANVHPPETQVRTAFFLPYVSHGFGRNWRGNLEAFLGMTFAPDNRPALGLTPIAQYGLGGFGFPNWFVEGGVGLFYTDVKVPGFGSVWTFSPQIGFGHSWAIGAGRSITLRLRYHHLSNAYLVKENTSIDSFLLMIGMDFGK
jgi:hypothetical protein